MIELNIDIFDTDSIQRAILDIEDLKERVNEKANQTVDDVAHTAYDLIVAFSPSGFSGDYIKSHHLLIKDNKALIWNDVRATTPYDNKFTNPLNLRSSSRSGWVGEQYASAVEYGYEAGWPLWMNAGDLKKGYRPYEKGTEMVVENVLPTVRAEFTLD